MFTRVICALAALISIAIAAPRVSAADLPERWLFYTADLSKPDEVDKAVAMMAQAKAAGCTAVQFNEPIRTGLFDATPEYVGAANRVLEAAKKADIKIVPNVFAFGYSGRYIIRDPNLAAGLPVKNARFIVHGGTALPDTAGTPVLANGGFDDAQGNTFAGWDDQELAGKNTFADRQVKHSGTASFKVAGLEGQPRGSSRSIYLSQTFKVKPFQYYHVTVWAKSDRISADGESYVNIHSADGKRHLSYTNLDIQPTEGWTRHETTFNTLDATEVVFAIGVAEARRGTVWFDDVTIEPAGLLSVVQRDSTPFVVTNEDGSGTYVKGQDFEPVKPSTADELYERRAVAKPLVLTAKSRIKEGDVLLLSYFHTVLIYQDQLGCTVEDPAIFDMMDLHMKRASEIWKAKDYMMGYDEIRIAGWEDQPGGAHLAPGQLLAANIRKGIEIAHKYVPGATLYAWSDMFTPHQNAYSLKDRGHYYYLVNGNWDGSWQGLPSDVVMMNWICDRDGLKWFADLGHKQIMAGFYDGDPKESVASWMETSKGLPGIIGMMYTTWQQDYTKMPEFFRLLKQYPDWKD